MKYEYEEWFSDVDSIEYSDYWNNEELEKHKPWYILNGNYEKMETFLKKQGFIRQLEVCINLLKNKYQMVLKGIGADLAAGNLWAVSYLLKLGNIEKIFCLEYSKHRLIKIGPKVLEHYNVPSDKVKLILGNFYKLNFKNKYLDFVFLSAAFHHAEYPNRLLSEIKRVLKPQGIVIIIGEHIREVTFKIRIKHYLTFFISKLPIFLQKKIFGKIYHVKTLSIKDASIFESNPTLGDHYYTPDEYRDIFTKHGFEFKNIRLQDILFQSFILINKS